MTDGTAKTEHFEKLQLIKNYLPNITISKRKRDDVEEKTKVPSKKSKAGAVLDSGASRAAASTLLDLTAAQKNVNEDNKEEQLSTEEVVDATLTQEDADTYLHRFESFEPVEKLQELLDKCPEEGDKIIQKNYNAFWGEVKGVLISPIYWSDIRSYIDEGWVATSVVAGFFQLLKIQHDNNHRSILECEFGMLLNQPDRSNADEWQIIRMLPV